jgi:polysaccharide biosynthesis transport protein
MSFAPVLVSPPSASNELDLRHGLDVLRRRRGVAVAVFTCVMALGVAGTFLLKPLYRASTKVLVLAPSTQVSHAEEPGDAATDIWMTSVVRLPTVAAQADEMRSARFVEKAMEAAKIPPGDPKPRVSVAVPEDREADVLTVSVESGNPEEVARLANAMGDLYVAGISSLEKESLDRAIRRMRTERDRAAARLRELTTRIAQFHARYPLDRLMAERDPRIRHEMELEARVEAARQALEGKKALITELEAKLAAEPPFISSEVVRDNPRRLELEGRLRQLNVQRLELLEDFQATSPEVRTVEAQIASLSKELAKEPDQITQTIRVPNPRLEFHRTELNRVEVAQQLERETYRAALADLAVRKQRQNAPDNLGILQAELGTLSGERERAQANLDLLSNRLEVLKLRRFDYRETARVLDRALAPTAPAQPGRLLLLVLSTGLALLLALVVPFLLEQCDDRVRASWDVEQTSLVPVLGSVPALARTSGRMLPAVAGDAGVTDAYWTLRCGIRFASLESPIRMLQVTSALPGEGKTTTAINLATVMAMEGKKVLLVDADFRNPSLHHRLHLSGWLGLAEVLQGDAQAEDAIQMTEVERLQVLCAGAAPANAPELLASEQFGALLARLQERVDMIIFDTPACLPHPDSSLVAMHMDGVLLVVQDDQTRKAEVQQAVEMLERVRARIVGVLLNRPRRTGGLSLPYFRDRLFPGLRDRLLPGRQNCDTVRG